MCITATVERLVSLGIIVGIQFHYEIQGILLNETLTEPFKTSSEYFLKLGN